MGFANNVIPNVRCPKCHVPYLLTMGCPECGLSHGKARVLVTPSLCCCDAERCEPSSGGEGWNVIHDLRPTCPTNRGVEYDGA